MMNIVQIDEASRAMVDAAIRESWGGPMIVSNGRILDTSERVFLDEPPARERLTYPDIIPALIARTQEWRRNEP